MEVKAWKGELFFLKERGTDRVKCCGGESGMYARDSRVKKTGSPCSQLRKTEKRGNTERDDSSGWWMGDRGKGVWR
jgi:hypothetical protein